MGIPAVRQFIEGAATGGLFGGSFYPIILKHADSTSRVILHIPCSLCCALLEAV